jgi:hypothetical protein
MRTAIVLFPLLVTLLIQAQTGDGVAGQTKAEIIKKTDKLMGQRYTPTAAPIRHFDEERESGPPDAVLYWYGASYVVEFIFATDGSLSNISVLPEALLHSDSWSDVPKDVELSRSQMEWLIGIADQLQPMGKIELKRISPEFCFQSGANLYCGDGYEHATVGQYWREELDGGFERLALKDIRIAYKKLVSGTIADTRAVEGDENKRDLKIGSSWYRIDRSTNERFFAQAAKGSIVELTTTGCSGNQKVCDASGPLTPMPEE